jgi:serine/threonine protein phosphatase PrpC
MTQHNQPGRLVGCSVRGPKHVEAGTPCEDAWAGDRLDAGRFVIAAGDGLGSADRSDEGSTLATETAVTTIAEELSEADTFSQDRVEAAVEEGVTEAREALVENAEAADDPLNAFGTTLLVAVATPDGVGGAVVGDGGIVVEQDSSFDNLVPGEMQMVDLPASHVTIPLTNENWESSYRYRFTEEYDGVAVFTDGFDEFVRGRDGIKTDFLQSVFELVRDIGDPEEAAAKMQEIFSDDPFTDFDDDKTIVVSIPPTREEE